MKIYTKTGDKGETSLFGGTRVPKDHRRIEAYGAVDELNAHLGVIRSLKPPPALEKILVHVQENLFVLGADLATPRQQGSEKTPRIDPAASTTLERFIDDLDATLPPLKNFILPGGSPVASHLHVARTVCRRAERCIVALGREEGIGTDAVVFVNRLSDLLFVMARSANQAEKIPDTPWKSPR